jgi:hypothetical protein
LANRLEDPLVAMVDEGAFRKTAVEVTLAVKVVVRMSLEEA